MHYEGTVIRPPSEAESLIFQVTLGCSDNNCIFCPAYKDKIFSIKNLSLIEKEFKEASSIFPETKKIFLADGDALIMPFKELLKVTEIASFYFPKLQRIATYASSKSIRLKTLEELKILRHNKMRLIYLGIETGDPEVYKNIKKFGNIDIMVFECLKVKEAGIKLNVTLILGLGGKTLSAQHAINTANILNKIKPDQIAALTLMIVPGTEISVLEEKKEFKLPDKIELIEELYEIINNLSDFNCLFFSNHASNYFPINARLPKDKSEILFQLKQIINSKEQYRLRPEFLRGL
ncbi:MAG: oxygen-independent coproporphyrinogen III oxidase, Fe-S oxidoreductase [uncultured bacterium]|nr:MAG: oxygen-independent coproporphyrinogen III oxidase, Fe-S oxidoreductase [uncultured bacterium]